MILASEDRQQEPDSGRCRQRKSRRVAAPSVPALGRCGSLLAVAVYNSIDTASRPKSLTVHSSDTTNCWMLWIFLTLLFTTTCAASPPRFSARLSDGTRLDGNDLSDWHKPELTPRLDGQPLMEPNRPALWMLNRRLTPASPPPAFVEMISGDCLPGVAIDYRPSGEADVVQTGDYWVVRPAVSLHPPRPAESPRIRVLADFVRRVVWQRGGSDSYLPGTALLRDGRRLSFRTVRIRDGEVLMLQPEGVRRVGFGELAELHMPEADFWDSAVAEVAILSPELRTRLIQLDTDDGLIVTGSFDRFAAFAWGSERISDQWSHGIQPAWSLDLIWVPHARIRVCRMFAPNQMPLTRVPVVEQQGAPDASAGFWPARRDRNVRGGTLESGGLDFGWGFGVLARSRLTFPLPPDPSQFRCEFGLDRIAQDGGCARARISAGSGAGRTLYESPPHTGAQAVLAIGPLNLPAGETLHLEADPAHRERPPGADPFSIRDLANWLDPILEIEPTAWSQRIGQQISRRIPAWHGWTVRTDGQVTWPSRMRESHAGFGSFVRCVDVRDRPLVLSRSADLVPGHNFLLLAVSRTGSRDAKSNVQVLLDGEVLDEREIPYRDNWQTEVAPLVFPLTRSGSAAPPQAELEIRQAATPGAVPVFWEGILVTSRLPMIQTLFEDDAPLRTIGGEPADLTAAPRYTGAAAIALPPESVSAWRLERPVAIRERPQWGEFRFLRFAVRKSGGGRVGLELQHAETVSRPARYDLGVGEPTLPGAKRVWERALSDEWQVITRDLYADFGQLDIDEVVLHSPDGETAYIDHVYAARSGSDVQYLPVPKPDEGS